MNEHKEPIPSMIYNAAVGGHVTNSQQIIDENLNREQNDINQETVGSVPYNSTTPNGMGRIVLKKNDNFKEVVEAQTDGNTIFVIKYDYTLIDNVTVPNNCVLKFNGGSISGKYTITGQNTGIEAGLIKIFGTDIKLTGTWNVSEAYPEWFGAKGDGVNDDTTALQKCVTYFKGTASIILYKQYGVSSIYIEDFNVHIEGRGSGNTILIGLVSDTNIIHLSGVVGEFIIKNLQITTNKTNVIGIYSDGLPHFYSTAGMWYSRIINITFRNCYSAIKLRAIDNENGDSYDTSNQYFVVDNIKTFGATIDLDFIGQVGQNSFNNCYFEPSANRIKYIRINTKSAAVSDGVYLYLNNCSFVAPNQNVDALIEFIVTQQSQVFFNGCWFETINCAILKNPILTSCIVSNSVFYNCKIPYFVLGNATGCTVIIKKSTIGFYSPKARNNYDDHGLTYIDETGNTTEEELYSTQIYHKVINEETLAIYKVLTIRNEGVIDSYNTIIKHNDNIYNIVEIIDPSSNHLAYITLGQTIHIHRHDNKYSIFTQMPLIGTTTDRTDVIDTSKIFDGFMFYDKTLHKQLYWNGTAWVDATGTIV